jgi:hypothetical protein
VLLFKGVCPYHCPKKINKLSVNVEFLRSFTLNLFIFLMFAREEHQIFELLKDLQKTIILDLIITSNVARFKSFLQNSKALDQLNKLRNFF